MYFSLFSCSNGSTVECCPCHNVLLCCCSLELKEIVLFMPKHAKCPEQTSGKSICGTHPHLHGNQHWRTIWPTAAYIVHDVLAEVSADIYTLARQSWLPGIHQLPTWHYFPFLWGAWIWLSCDELQMVTPFQHSDCSAASMPWVSDREASRKMGWVVGTKSRKGGFHK